MRQPHDFHSMAYVSRWAADVDNPVRRSVFHHVLAHLVLLPTKRLHVVELACGPGILAAFLLERLPDLTWAGLDFSAPMLELAKDRLTPFGERASLAQVDLRAPDWTSERGRPAQAVISMQAMHDVGGEDEHARVYAAARRLIAPGGLFLNADFVAHAGGGPSRIAAVRHLEMLRAAGYEAVACSLNLDRYGCMVGSRAGKARRVGTSNQPARTSSRPLRSRSPKVLRRSASSCRAA